MRLPALCLAALLAGPAAAHEFWLSPESYQVAVGEEIRIATRVGDDFSGASYSRFPGSIERSEFVMDGEAVPTEGRIGDRPAIAQAAPGEGLLVVVHETDDSRVRYEDWAKWERFTTRKGFPEGQARHIERGGSRELLIEDYRRYAKSLVAVGAGEGADAPVGLDAEIVALANPYTQALTEMPLRVLYRGAPAPEKLIEVFSRPFGAPETEPEIAQMATDAEGVVRVPVEPGREYQIDSVFLDELDPPSPSGATFRTLWANLTFLVPEG